VKTQCLAVPYRFSMASAKTKTACGGEGMHKYE